MSQADNLAALGSNVNASGVLQPAGGGTGATTSTGTGSAVLSISPTISSPTLINATINGAVASGFTMKNRIINGDMVIDQRNNGASITPTTDGQYTIDRWKVGLTQTSRFSIQQNAGAVTPPAGFTNYLGATSLSAYSVGSGDTFLIQQNIEGFNVADLNWGTANARTVTLSFWVRSSLTGTFGGSVINNAANRAYLFSYTISSANTWTQISITVAGDTTGTWLTNSLTGIVVRFGLGSGSSFSGGPTGVWQAGNIVQPTGTVSVVGTNGATFYITGVQLEQGSSATSFEWLPIGMELLLCQRYYQLVTSIFGGGHTSTVAAMQATFQVPMRAAATIGLQGVIQVSDSTNDYIQSSASISNLGTTNNASIFFLSTFTGLTVSRVLFGPRNSANTNTVTLSAEI